MSLRPTAGWREPVKWYDWWVAPDPGYIYITMSGNFHMGDSVPWPVFPVIPLRQCIT